MNRRKLFVAGTLTLGCARAVTAPTTAALCGPSEPPPASWIAVKVPAASAHIRLPPSYRVRGNEWVGPDGERVRMASAPHWVPDPRDPEGIGVLTGPSCTMRKGDRVVGISYWTEFPMEGGAWDAVSASWQETPGTDVAITAIARDTKGRREQLKILHSLE